jgi:DNA-binding MarR family transcriptional regulator
MAVPTAHHQVEKSFGGLCRFANQAIHAECARRLADAGYEAVRQPHFPVFRVLNNDPEGLSSTQLAEQMKLSKPTVKELVDHLEREGFVERVPHPTDRRAHLVRLTEAGWAFTEVCWPIVAQLEAEVTQVVGADAIGVVREALERVAAAFDV